MVSVVAIPACVRPLLGFLEPSIETCSPIRNFTAASFCMTVIQVQVLSSVKYKLSYSVGPRPKPDTGSGLHWSLQLQLVLIYH